MGERSMPYRNSIGTLALAAALTVSMGIARAFDETKFPNWKGQWSLPGGGQGAPWDPAKPAGLAQQAPLTPEYQAIYEAILKNPMPGGPGSDPTSRCIPAGMPRVMMAVQPMEIVITPDATYIMLELFSTLRRIYTDGRAFPNEFEPSFTGYSIGQWQDADGDGRFDTLTIETRAIKGPHTYDGSGTPFHKDGEAVVKEKIFADKANPDILYNEITTADHALTRPWAVTRSYRRDPQLARPDWSEFICAEDTRHVQIGDENYTISPDGLLMPVRKGQKPPDLKYFK
jgi:hypothetical protein